MPRIGKLNTGVYKIQNVHNGKVYVGSAAISFEVRFMSHRNGLRRGRHDNSYLQRAWNKWGESNFEFSILERCHPSVCIEREQYWMDNLSAYDRNKGYNIAPSAGSMRGYRHTDKTKKDLSIIIKKAMWRDDVREAVRRGQQKRVANPNLAINARAGVLNAYENDPTISVRLSLSQKARFASPEQRKHRSVVTPELASSIRRLYKWRDAEFGTYGLAEKFNVSQRTVCLILKKKTWVDM